MARATPVVRLEHILEALARIGTLTAGKSFDDYTADWMMRDALERNLERLCEASRHNPDDVRMRHAYDKVLDERIWGIS